MEKVLVAGSGFGGIRAAIDLHRKGFDVEIVDKDLEHVYKPGLIDLVRKRVSKDDLTIDVEKLFSGTTIKTSREEITGFRPKESIVELEKGEIEYDYLVLALGGSPKTKIDSEDIIHPYSIDESFKLANTKGSVAIIGSGYTGIEYAAELEAKGLDVHIYDSMTRPLPSFSENVSLKVLDYLNRYEIGFTGGKELTVSENGIAEFVDGPHLTFDRIVWCGGVEPVEVIRESFGSEGLKVNKGLCSIEYDNIFGIGMCNNREGNSAHQSLKEAKVAAKNISKEDYENLELVGEFSPGFLISLGRTGMFIRNGNSRKSLVFRYCKDIVRKAYMWNLKKEKILLKNLM